MPSSSTILVVAGLAFLLVGQQLFGRRPSQMGYKSLGALLLALGIINMLLGG